MPRRIKRQAVGLALWAGVALTSPSHAEPIPPAAATCQQRIYLTLDTGHMGVAELIAQVLREKAVRATFFAANERTQEGDGSLGKHWAAWWKERAAEGHQLASHTFDHVYWLADLPNGGFKVRPSAGPLAHHVDTMSANAYCTEIERASHRLEAITGQASLPLFRAPGGKVSPALLRAARACGYAHVGWSATGFLGDELPSERYPNAQLLQNALKHIHAGDILVAHLGIWSRHDPWAPAVFRPLIEGLQAKGFCFDTLDHHPSYQTWIKQHGRVPQTTGGNS